MNVFTKRNALVGFLTLKALEQRRKRKLRRRSKVATAVGLGVVSVGLLAGFAVLRHRRSQSEPAAEQEREEPEDEIVGEVVGPSTEPVTAT